MFKIAHRLAVLAALLAPASAMATPQVLSTVGPGPVVPLSRGSATYFTLKPSLLCKVPTGSVLTYSIEVTADNVLGSATPPEWFPLDPSAVNQTTGGNFRIETAISGVRFNVTSYTSGSLICEVAQ